MAATKKAPAKKSAAKKTTKSVSKETPALGSMVDSNSSVSVRQIENGFIVSESGYTGKGRNQQYYNKDYFSPTNPVAGVSKIKFGKK